MNYLDLDIPERQGIYLFILPNLKVGYVGSSNNLKRRYLQHIGVTKGGNKVIKDQVDRENKVEYMILEFCDGYSNKDLKLIESSWIKHFRLKGLKLINVSEPTTEPTYNEPKPLVAYNVKTLEFVGEFESSVQAAKKMKCSPSGIISAVIGRKLYKRPTKMFTIKGCFWFYKNGFTTELLFQRKQEYETAKINGKKQQILSTSKKINQYTKSGDLIKTWSSASEAARELNISSANISHCCRGRLKSTGGYIWRYAEESEKTN